MRFVILSTMLVVSASTYASSIKIVERASCNEIQLQENENRWSTTHGGGSFSAEDSVFSGLKNGVLDEVSYGRKGSINLLLLGKDVIPGSMSVSDKFGLEVQSLVDRNQDAIVGKFIGLTDNYNPILDPTAQFGSRESLRLGIIILKSNLATVQLEERCTYIARDVQIEDAEGGCIWFDSQSRGLNGKPYCW